MVDRRTETRKKLMAFSTVRDRRQGALLGYLANLTSHGLLVIGEKPLELDAHITLEIEFPDELPETATRRMIIDARVARCVPDPENPREFNLGFEFLNIQSEHTRIIHSLLERYHFRYRD
jgi:hypothetical protein